MASNSFNTSNEILDELLREGIDLDGLDDEDCSGITIHSAELGQRVFQAMFTTTEYKDTVTPNTSCNEKDLDALFRMLIDDEDVEGDKSNTFKEVDRELREAISEYLGLDDTDLEDNTISTMSGAGTALRDDNADDLESEDAFSQDTTTKHITSENTNSEIISSADTSSADASCEDTNSDDTSSYDTSSEDTSSEDMSSEDMSSEDTISESTSSEDTSSDSTCSEGTSSQDDAPSILSELDAEFMDAVLEDLDRVVFRNFIPDDITMSDIGHNTSDGEDSTSFPSEFDEFDDYVSNLDLNKDHLEDDWGSDPSDSENNDDDFITEEKACLSSLKFASDLDSGMSIIQGRHRSVN